MRNEVKQLNSYIKYLQAPTSFGTDNIVVEHRSGNPKRDYLFVNKAQGKHIPCAPSAVIHMCNLLVEQMTALSKYKSILVVAFAETATAIGNVVADLLPNCHYIIQTTRESIADTQCVIKFEEEHSHATTHQLLCPDTDIFDPSGFDYILFIDDEITTGKTIMNFIDAFKEQYIDSNFKFGVASICNWQDINSHMCFRQRGIDFFCLISGNIADVHSKMDISSEDLIVDANTCRRVESTEPYRAITYIKLPFNERVLHKSNQPLDDILKYVKTLSDDIKTVRVIGTEEFMYIPLRCAEYLEQNRLHVLFHNSTRSNIDIIANSPDGLVAKYKFPSVYDSTRDTYIYNLDEYTELTLVITDRDVTKETALAMSKVLNTGELIILSLSKEEYTNGSCLHKL